MKIKDKTKKPGKGVDCAEEPLQAKFSHEIAPEFRIDKFGECIMPEPPAVSKIDLLKIEHQKELAKITDRLNSIEIQLTELFNILKLIGGRENVKGTS